MLEATLHHSQHIAEVFYGGPIAVCRLGALDVTGGLERLADGLPFYELSLPLKIIYDAEGECGCTAYLLYIPERDVILINCGFETDGMFGIVPIAARIDRKGFEVTTMDGVKIDMTDAMAASVLLPVKAAFDRRAEWVLEGLTVQ